MDDPIVTMHIGRSTWQGKLSELPMKEQESMMTVEHEMPERIWLSPEGAHLPYQPTMHWEWQEYRRSDLCASGHQAATPIAQEAVPVGIAGNMPGTNGGFTMAVFNASDVPEGAALFTRPPQPSVTVAEAINAVLKWENKLVRSDDDLKERNAAFAALRALKG